MKNVGELAAILKKFFFEIDLGKEKLSKNVNLDIKLNESKERKEIIKENAYKFLKLEGIQITSKQATKKANHYRINYLNKYQNTGFFFLDSYFRDKKELIKPNLVGDFLLVRGYKYQFFIGFG